MDRHLLLLLGVAAIVLAASPSDASEGAQDILLLRTYALVVINCPQHVLVLGKENRKQE